MGKNPAFQFYPSDWSRDLEEHPLEIEGAWIRICCKLWWAEKRGELARTSCQWAKILRTDENTAKTILEYLGKWKIGDVSENSNGEITVISRRMARDEKDRENNAERQRRFKGKTQGNGSVTPPVTEESQDSSSSSSPSKKEKTLVPDGTNPSCPHLKIIEEYNRILGPYLPEVKASLWGGKRSKWLQARWKERASRQKIEWWTGYFEYIRDSCKFLTGENDRGWKADLEWVINASNMVKIIEGKYETTGRKLNSGNGSGKPRILDGAASGAGKGKEPDTGPPETHGGKGIEESALPLADDGRGRHGEAEKGN